MTRILYQALLLHNNIRIYCWQHGKHEIYDKISHKIDDVIDSFVKNHGRMRISDQYNLIKLKNMTTTSIVHTLNNAITFFETDIYKYLDDENDKVIIEQSIQLVNLLEQALLDVNRP
jgi:hypothetical protein